jgi:four helix bundle protein
MKEYNVIQQKSFAFAIRVVNIYRFLVEEKQEYTLSKQLVRSGTSIGANVEEALGGVSDKDFLHKLSIAYKEARETIYWLRLLQAPTTSQKHKQQALSPMQKSFAESSEKSKPRLNASCSHRAANS